ncbi:hypothetical protein HA402_010388 [Bradysia odoriphaga]|nr:hypothetical protein HA402_010388 [Bradysia odoriphaga]
MSHMQWGYTGSVHHNANCHSAQSVNGQGAGTLHDAQWGYDGSYFAGSYYNICGPSANTIENNFEIQSNMNGHRFLQNQNLSVNFGNFETPWKETSNQPQFNRSDIYYDKDDPTLKNQNLSVNFGNFETQWKETSNQPQFNRSDIYYDKGDPTLKNQNLFLSSNTYHPNYNVHYHGGYHRNYNSSVSEQQWGHVNSNRLLEDTKTVQQISHNYHPHYNVRYHGGIYNSSVGEHQWDNVNSNRHRPLEYTNEVQNPDIEVNGYPKCWDTNKYMPSSDCYETHSSPTKYQQLSKYTAPAELFATGIKLFATGIKLFATGIKLLATGIKLFATGIKLLATGIKLFATGIKLFATGIKLLATGIKLFATGIKLFTTWYQAIYYLISSCLHLGDRLRLINYLEYLHDTPLLADQVVQSENPMPANQYGNTADGDANDLDANVNVIEQDDVDVNGFDVDLDVMERDDDETKRNAITDSLITKRKFQIGCDNSHMFVETSDCPSTKRLCCPFCDKLFIKLARHMEDKHKTEEDVKKFMSFPKGSKPRLLILDSLRKTGQDNWNNNPALNKGKMITCRRPNKKFGNESTRFKTCPYCIGQYTRGSLRLHVRNNCPRKPILNEEAKGKRFITALATSVEARYHEKASAGLQKVYKRFRDDALVRSLKFDWLITVYGNKQAAKYSRLKSRPMIKGQLRLIARFLQELKRIEPEVKDLATLYHPKYFDRMVEAIQAVARFDGEKNEYGAPATASSCVTLVKKIGAILISEYIKRDDQEHQRLAKNFMTVMNIDIHNMINKTVNENQSKMRRRRVVNLPSLADLKLLNEYIQSESYVCYDKLSKSFDYKNWVYLSKLTMISILIFNRKRVGDVENITLDDYQYKEEMSENTNQELFASLSDEAKNLARRYSRMRVRGKLNRTVPVLLNQTMRKCLELLISHREGALIEPKNDHLFALQPSPIEDINVINAGTTLKKFVELSGVKNPSSINATNMRKQLATMCVSMKLDDGEVADVADFMGHAELVHRNSYRQNTIDRQVVKMSQWLEAALGNETLIDTERKTDDESLQKASKLLQLLDAALGDEESSDDNVRPSEFADLASNIRMKSKVPPAATRKRKQPAVATKQDDVDVNGFDVDLDVMERDDDETKRNAITDSLITKRKFQIGCDNSHMFVETSDCPSTKRLCCPFCDKLFIKLARHMEDKHKTEEDVKKFMSFPKGSKPRLLILDSLRKTGQDNWNNNPALNKGKMITCRRPNKKFGNESTRFKTCPYCIGQYTRGSLRLHVRNNCPRKPILNEEAKGKRFITALATSVEARYHEKASAGLQKVYKRFRDDALVRSLKFDWLITVYGNKQAAKYSRLKSRPMIKGQLRLIARFLQELKRIEPEVKDLATLYHPKYFDRMVEAIQAVARFDGEKNEYGAPATASSCVTLVKKIGAILISEYIKRDDQEHQRLAKNFMTVMNIDIHNMINKTVNENQSKMRRRRVVNLPSLADLKLLNEYIQSESYVCYDKLSKSFDYKNWVYLSKLTMISILIFNRKRVGDVENITLDDYQYKEEMSENTNQELFASLSDEAKNLARRYSRMRVRGKLNRTVPVLLNQTMRKCLELLISHREGALIEPKNDHLFALQPSPIEDINVINAGTTLKKFVELSGVKNPSSINATNMRKQLATMCVSMKLDDGEVADVADFMGHAELVHRNSYRQNTIDRQVVKMSQWLEAALGNETLIDTERKTDDESLQKASKLLQLLDAALGDEESSDDNVRPSEFADLASNIRMKSKVPPAATRKRKQPAVATMKSKRVTGKNRKAVK